MASIVFEVECEVEGNVTRADESVGYGGNEIEDADVSSVSMVKAGKTKNGKFVWDNVDLLDGLDKTARNIIIANIMKTFASDIDDAIIQDATA